MSTRDDGSNRNDHIFLAKLVRTLNPFINFIFGAIILDVIANVISQPLQLPPTWKTYLQFLINWGIKNPAIAASIACVLFLFKYTFTKLKDIDIPPSFRTLEREYLESVERTTEMFVPEGLPTHIHGFTALLSAVFYSPMFYPNTHVTDFLP